MAHQNIGNPFDPFASHQRPSFDDGKIQLRRFAKVKKDPTDVTMITFTGLCATLITYFLLRYAGTIDHSFPAEWEH